MPVRVTFKGTKFEQSSTSRPFKVAVGSRREICLKIKVKKGNDRSMVSVVLDPAKWGCRENGESQSAGAGKVGS